MSWLRWGRAVLAIAIIGIGGRTSEAEVTAAELVSSWWHPHIGILKSDEPGFGDPAQEIPVADLPPKARKRLSSPASLSVLFGNEHPRLFEAERVGFTGTNDKFNSEVVGEFVDWNIGKLINDRVIISNTGHKGRGAPIVREGEDGNVGFAGWAF